MSLGLPRFPLIVSGSTYPAVHQIGQGTVSFLFYGFKSIQHGLIRGFIGLQIHHPIFFKNGLRQLAAQVAKLQSVGFNPSGNAFDFERGFSVSGRKFQQATFAKKVGLVQVFFAFNPNRKPSVAVVYFVASTGREPRNPLLNAVAQAALA